MAYCVLFSFPILYHNDIYQYDINSVKEFFIKWDVGRRTRGAAEFFSGTYRWMHYIIFAASRGKGSGFSYTNLGNMRNFYVTYSIRQPAGELEWSKYVELLSLKNEKKRKAIEKR